MKKNYLFLTLFSLIGSISNAQTIPNGNFEQWVYNSNNLSYEPVGWTTANLGFYGDTGVRRYKPARTGNYACGLKTDFILNAYTIPAVLMTTFPVSVRPLRMVGYIKGNIAQDDTTVIYIEFSRDSTIIADSSIIFTQSMGAYTKFELPFTFYGAGNPDSCRITIYSGGTEPGDTLTEMAIDDLGFEYPVGIGKVSYRSGNILLYPNPASDRLNIQCEEVYSNISIYNATGQLVATHTNDNIIDVNLLEKGIYYMLLTDKGSIVVGQKSFIKN